MVFRLCSNRQAESLFMYIELHMFSKIMAGYQAVHVVESKSSA